MKRKKLYAEQSVEIDCEYDIDFNDLLELVESCDENEKDEIREIVGTVSEVKVQSIYDVSKYELLKEAFDKYSLEELNQKLK